MKTIKIMPCLDMKNGRVVKGVHFVDIRDAGDPVENAAFYEKEGADELAMLDIAATLENRPTRLEWVRQVAAVINIPLLMPPPTVSGMLMTAATCRTHSRRVERFSRVAAISSIASSSAPSFS